MDVSFSLPRRRLPIHEQVLLGTPRFPAVVSTRHNRSIYFNISGSDHTSMNPEGDENPEDEES
jgi:hypothetical protein